MSNIRITLVLEEVADDGTVTSANKWGFRAPKQEVAWLGASHFSGVVAEIVTQNLPKLLEEAK